MNTKTQKTFAREIIYFFSVVVVVLIFWAGIEIRNYFLKNEINYFSENILELNIKIDSIQKTLPEKIKTFKEFAQSIKKKYPEYKDIDDYELAMKVVEKYPEYKDQVNFSEGKPNPFSSETAHIKDLGLNTEESNINDGWKQTEIFKKEKDELEQKVFESKNKLLLKNETTDIIVWSSALLFSILYPIRLIFLLLKWAFKTVKQKE